MASSRDATQERWIDRFRVLETLGESTRDGLYVAHDGVLDRRVMVRTLTHHALGDTEARDELMRSARAVSRFRHPHCAAIFEAGPYEAGLYLVFEYIEGETLDVFLEGARLPLDRALTLMREIVDALAAAHDQGIVHGSLQPANITVGKDGHARVTGLGLALPRGGEQTAGHQTHTRHYLAPEQLRGGVPSCAADVFSLGALFFELLAGQRAFSGDSEKEIADAIETGVSEPPSRVAGEGDERLDAIVLRALQPDPHDRYATAHSLREAFLAVAEGRENEEGDAGDFILRRIRRKPDFPGVSAHIREITQCSDDSQRRSVAELSNAVLKDYATTQKLLRLANSPFYSNFGGNIRTVSRAVVLLGFEQVRTAALGLVLLENLKGGSQSTRLMQALVQTLFSAMLARNLARQLGGVESEQAFVCALFHDIGRMLALYYLPEEADEIQIRQTQGVSEETAARQVLGISYEALGRSVLEDWNFPREIVQAVERAPEGALPPVHDADRRLHRIVTLASEMAGRIIHHEPSEQELALAELRRRYKASLDVEAAGMRRAIHEGRDHLDQFLSVVKLPREGQEHLRQLRHNLGVRESGSGHDTPDEAVLLDVTDDPSAEGPDSVPAPPTEQAAALMESLTDMLDAMVDGFELHPLVQTTLENIYQVLGLRRAMLMLADRERRTLVAHTAFGHEAESLSGRLRLSLTGSGNVLSLAMTQRKDMVISDSSDPAISRYIPREFRDALDARSFLLLPLGVRERCVGLLYLELPSESTELDPLVLRALKSVRNQLALAICEARS
ncbi:MULTISPECIES: HDOD domain-containing protein [unclassified Thioalkalivibrio]|uniref:HDOD domain-containing protein n=1 Tax=unclassified Thioalkalivibrio TaxID=2621013 RepID=UPI0003730CB5|nr:MULTISPECIES: HDOD domain-containing protein [unclassified Thioalkalivibrio]